VRKLDSNSDHKIPLEELLKALESAGYEISIENVLEIQSVLLSSPVSRMKLGEIKYFIAPLVAKNDDDQKNIYKIVDAWISDKVNPIFISSPEEKQPGFWTRLKRDRDLIFSLKIIGFALIISTGLVFYFINNIYNRKISIQRKERVIITEKKRVPGNTPRMTTLDNRTVSAPENKRPEEPGLELVESAGTIIPQSYSINLQMSLIFGIPIGIIIAYLIFYERRRRMELISKKKLDPGGLDPLGVDGDKTGSMQQGISEQVQQVVLKFPDQDFLIRKGPELYEIRSNLKKPAIADDLHFDIRKSIYKTSRSAGFTSLAYSNPPKERKYLFIIENNQPAAHLTNLFKYLVTTISATRIPARTLTYTSDLHALQDAGGHIVYLEDLVHDYSDHHLVILGNCHSFFSEDDILDNELLTIFQNWQSRSIITPVPLPDWGILERELQENKFNIVPADIEAVELLSKSVTANIPIKKGQLEGRIHDLYSVSNADFYSVEGLRAYLDNEKLFQAVCSLAVYPRLSWEITLVLVSAILKRNAVNGNGPAPDFDTFLKISRIPWLSATSIEEPFRLQLLEKLELNTEIIARETLIRLLQEVKPFTQQGSLAYQEFDTQFNVNTFFLFAHDPHQYRQYADSKNRIVHYWTGLEDWALKERTGRGESGLMPMQSSGHRVTVEEFVLMEKQFEKRNITFYKIVLVTLPSILLYIIFSIFRPALVYPETYKPVSMQVVIRKEECRDTFQKALVSINGRTDTIPLSLTSAVDTIPIREIDYDRSITVSVSSGKGVGSGIVFTAIDSFVVLSARCNAE
jgi:hypothetical protein